MSAFSRYMKEARSKAMRPKPLSGAAAAEEIGVTRPALVEWETGVGLPNPDRLPKIAAVYGLDLDELRTAWAMAKAGGGE